MTVLVVRHARSTANASGILAGRSSGVGLDSTGAQQSRTLVDRLGALPIKHLASSPMARCQETFAALSEHLQLPVETIEELSEVDYGKWTGKKFSQLKDQAYSDELQYNPITVDFPGGEGLRDVSFRASSALRAHDAQLARSHGHDVLWAVCSHGDVIKSVLADALGMHLNNFHSIVIDNASASIIRYNRKRSFVLCMNDTGSVLNPALIQTPMHLQDDSDVIAGGRS